MSRYWNRYRLVLVTNTRDFVLVGEDAAGRPAKLETFRLAEDAEDFRPASGASPVRSFRKSARASAST